MKPQTGTVRYGKQTIRYRVQYVDRRTLEIAVHPDKTVTVRAPAGTAPEHVQAKVAKRAGWMARQIDFFGQFDPKTPKRRFRSGETHLYLGRRYRLRVVRGGEGVRLTRGEMHVPASSVGASDEVRYQLADWYRQRADVQFQERFDECWRRFQRYGKAKPRLDVRGLKKRWGSLSRAGRLTLNVDLVRAPGPCIDYVITHELCHLVHSDHGPKFWGMLEKVMPDWEKRKERLERALA